MQGISKALVVLGIVLVVVGLLLRFAGGKLGWLGHLPGDLRIGDSVYVPITSCLLVSAVLTLLVNLIGRFFGR